jgi:hypothetical protein
MKKWISVILLAVILFITSIYILIPSSLVVSKVSTIHCTSEGASRFLTDPGTWHSWLAGNSLYEQDQAKHFFQYKGISYSLKKKLFNAADILITQNGITHSSSITIFRIITDSIVVHWQTSFKTSLNPFKRLKQYFDAKDIKMNINDILSGFIGFAEKTENLYGGYNIKPTTIADTLVITSKSIIDHYPSTEEIYYLVDGLKNYISLHKGNETNPPMLNVIPVDSVSYRVMVGIPINKLIPENSKFFTRRLVPMQNKTLTTDVKGGYGSIKKAFHEIEIYMNDHTLSAPVIPFEYMITDRRMEKDSSKWITRIYYPII